MKLSDLKSALDNIKDLSFRLPDGSAVPAHFHVTEIGQIDKTYIDCGGTMRVDRKVSLQLWTAEDYDHGLKSEKLQNIIQLAEDKLKISDAEIEVEYQGNTIEKYDLELIGNHFHLVSTQTDCLAKDKCDIPEKANQHAFQIVDTSGCTPGSGCC